MQIIFIQGCSGWSSYFTRSLPEFYEMLEDDCFQIDIRLASEIAQKNSNECPSINNTFKEYVEKCTELANMDVRTGKISDEIR